MSRKGSEIDDDLPDDLIWGVGGKEGMAAFLGITPRRAYYLIEQKILPVKKHGHRIRTARRSVLRRLFTSDSE